MAFSSALPLIEKGRSVVLNPMFEGKDDPDCTGCKVVKTGVKKNEVSSTNIKRNLNRRKLFPSVD